MDEVPGNTSPAIGFGKRGPAKGAGKTGPVKGIGKTGPAKGVGKKDPTRRTGKTGPVKGIDQTDPVMSIGTTADGTDDIVMDETGTGIEEKIGPVREKIGIDMIDVKSGLQKDMSTRQAADDQGIPGQKRPHDETDQDPPGQLLLTSPKSRTQ